LVLEVEILPRFTLRQGVPFVVSAVTRYLLVTAGVLVAMVAKGIDLTKVTLLAGALGVTRFHLLLLGGGLLLLGRIGGRSRVAAMPRWGPEATAIRRVVSSKPACLRGTALAATLHLGS
jgi:hypothetical protein